MSKDWNHNIYYHDLILKAVPKPCFNALDVGCGDGLLSRKLALCCNQVTGIDLDRTILNIAKKNLNTSQNITYIQGDAINYTFQESSFNLITVVATLHHLPLNAALQRLEQLLAPGGLLVIIGLYKAKNIADLLRAAVAFPISWLMRYLYHHQKMNAPIATPKETIAEIKTAAAELLPGAIIKHRFFHRYSLTWRKPESNILFTI